FEEIRFLRPIYLDSAICPDTLLHSQLNNNESPGPNQRFVPSVDEQNLILFAVDKEMCP
ncbi:hypothetical protein Q9189_007789, partial [Teloschistes chrysophthalmus]